MTDSIERFFKICSDAISQNSALAAQNSALAAQNAALKVQNSELEAQIAQFLVRKEGTAAYVTELQSCLAMQKRALEAQCRDLEAQRQELEARYEHIIDDMSQENCQLQCRNERLSMETSELLKSLQSLHDPRSWIRSSADQEIFALSAVLSEISPNVVNVKRISNELASLQTIVPEYLTSSNASTHESTEREKILQQLLGDQERLCAEQRALEGKIFPCEEVVGPLLYTIFQKVKASILASEMYGE